MPPIFAVANPVVDFFVSSWLGNLLGLGGLAWGLYSHIVNRRVKKLACEKRETSIVGTSTAEFSKDVKVLFDGREMAVVTSTQWVIWNAGNVAIHGTDVSRVDPVRFEADSNTEILDVKIVKMTRTVVDPKIVQQGDPRMAEISFDFLDPSDGFILQVVHSGFENQIRLVGTVKGIPAGIVRFNGKAFMSRRRRLASIGAGISHAFLAVWALWTGIAARPWLKNWSEIRLRQLGPEYVGFDMVGPPSPESLAWSCSIVSRSADMIGTYAGVVGTILAIALGFLSWVYLRDLTPATPKSLTQ